MAEASIEQGSAYHEFSPSKRGDSCDFTNWQDRGPWIVCDYPAAAHPRRMDAMLQQQEPDDQGIAEGHLSECEAEVRRIRPVADAARAFVEWHLKGQPKTPGTLYPFTYAEQEAWHDEWDRRLDALIAAVAAAGSSR